MIDAMCRSRVAAAKHRIAELETERTQWISYTEEVRAVHRSMLAELAALSEQMLRIQEFLAGDNDGTQE